VKFGSPNGSVAPSSVLLSLPLTTAMAVFVPGPVTSTVSRKPSPLKSPVAVRTSPAKLGKTGDGVTAGGGVGWGPAGGAGSRGGAGGGPGPGTGGRGGGGGGGGGGWGGAPRGGASPGGVPAGAPPTDRSTGSPTVVVPGAGPGLWVLRSAPATTTRPLWVMANP